MLKSFVLRIDTKLFEAIKRQAVEKSISINSHVAALLTQRSSATGRSLAVTSIIQKKWAAKLIGIVLFGSTARGSATPSSDIDLMIVLDEGVPIGSALYRDWTETMSDDFEKVSPHFVHLPNDLSRVGSLWLEVAMEGKIVMDTSAGLETHLRKLRQAIAEGQFKRSYSYGVPYWKKVA